MPKFDLQDGSFQRVADPLVFENDRIEARRKLNELLWAKRFSEARFLSRVLWEMNVINNEDRSFVLDILSQVEETSVSDVSWN